MNKMEQVILVDQNDQQIGLMEKMEAHRKGELHRAFSVFVFNSKDELLLQKRALSKYHSGGLWTNTCCSHPRAGESVQDAANRRLKEEMGMECELRHAFSFIYKKKLDRGLIEHELDHVLVGHSNAIPQPDSEEVADWRFASLSKIRTEMEQSPESFTAWFRICFDQLCQHLSDHPN